MNAIGTLYGDRPRRRTFGAITAPGPVWSLVPRFAQPSAPAIVTPPASAVPSLPETTAPFVPAFAAPRWRTLLGW